MILSIEEALEVRRTVSLRWLAGLSTSDLKKLDQLVSAEKRARRRMAVQAQKKLGKALDIYA